jgi:serine/threonine-protein kinase
MDSPILVAQLGSGGMAEVFLAMRRGLGGFVKLVVVKRLRTSALEGDAVAMFHDEARISARLNHPNVVQTHEVGFDGEHYRLEMEYLDGQPLHRITHRAKRAGRPISIGMAAAVVQDVLAGLHYAHGLCDYDGTPLGIVHRDVSPQNVFVTYDGRVKLVDFGIAKASGQMAVTQLGMVKGKIRYMAPEQATGQPVDARTDVFATGIVLWQLLVGRGYWGDADELAIFQRLTAGQLPPGPRAENPEIPEDLDAVCAKALAFDPADRFATAEELRQALDACGVAEREAHGRLGALAAELFADAREKIRLDIERAAARPAGAAPPAAAVDPSADEVTRLAPSERPVSGGVRLPERRSWWSLAGAAGAAAAGAAIAIAAIRSIAPPSPAARHDGEVRTIVVERPVDVVSAPVAPAPVAPAPEARTEAAARNLPPPSARGPGVARAPDAGAASSPRREAEVADAGPSKAPGGAKDALLRELASDPWDAGGPRSW